MTNKEKFELVENHWKYIKELLGHYNITPSDEDEVCYWQGFYDGLQDGAPYNSNLSSFHYNAAFEHGDKHRRQHEA